MSFFCLVDIKAKDFFLESTNDTSREALDLIAQGPKVDTSIAKAIDASGNRFPTNAALLNRESRPVFSRAHGCTDNQKLSSKGGWVVSRNGLLGLGTRTRRDLFELMKSDERLVIIHPSAVRFMQGTNNDGVLRDPRSEAG